jgi:hypothetical protein
MYITPSAQWKFWQISENKQVILCQKLPLFVPATAKLLRRILPLP